MKPTQSLKQTTQKGIKIALTIFHTLLVITSLVHIVELHQRVENVDFFDVFYFVAVSSTTGLATDIVPDTLVSRTVILIVMVIGAIYLPSSLAELLDLSSRKSKYVHRYRLKSFQDHIVIMGAFDAAILGDFLREFFCLDHGTETMNMIVVILSPNEPTSEIVAILNDAYYVRRVKYVRGQETSFHSLSKVES
jgi:hypothetical protein